MITNFKIYENNFNNLKGLFFFENTISLTLNYILGYTFKKNLEIIKIDYKWTKKDGIHKINFNFDILNKSEIEKYTYYTPEELFEKSPELYLTIFKKLKNYNFNSYLPGILELYTKMKIDKIKLYLKIDKFNL